MSARATQRLALTIAVLAAMVAFLDQTVVNVALPAIRAELGGGLALQQWVVDAYLLTLAAFILLSGGLSDAYGRVRILRIGLVGFGVASLVIAAAPSGELLVLARGLQGVAGALLVPSALALIFAVFDGPAQGRAVGAWTAWTSGAMIAGPVVGGALVDLGSWRWVFVINVVPIAVTLLLLRRLTIDEERRSDARLDLPGALLAVVGLGATALAVIEAPQQAPLPLVVGAGVLGVAGLIGFVLRQARAPRPLLPLSLFRVRTFAAGNLATLAIYAALSLFTVVLTLYLQQVAGFSATAAGLAALPASVLNIALSPLFGSLSGRYGPRLFMTVGPLVAAAGVALLVRVGDPVDYVGEVLPAVLVFGLGLSITVAPLTSGILGSVDRSRSGIASAVNNAVSRVAGLFAVAAIGVVAGGQLDLNGLHRAGLVAAGLLVLGGVISAAGVRNPPRAAANDSP